LAFCVSQRFIGIDLAWKVDGNHTGLAVLEGDESGAHLLEISAAVRSFDAVCEFIDKHLAPTTVIAVDAPLIVTNAPGTARACERLVSARFGKYGASCHASNRASPVADVSRRLVTRLAKLDVSAQFDLANAAQRAGRWMFEVYPHPALIQLFDLERRLAYKKGRVDVRRSGQRALQKYLARLATRKRGLRGTATLRELLKRDVAPLKGGMLKANEDQLDALLCAYLAWHCWRWGGERNEVFGAVGDGQIVVPKAW
jgi:predicted RNase H-like nuclease